MTILYSFLDRGYFTDNMEKIKNISIDSNFSKLYDSCVYVLKCYSNEKDLRKESENFLYYTDSAKNPAERLKEHMEKRDRYTKRFDGNFKVSYVELYNDLMSAQERKERIRKLRRNQKKALTTKKVSGVCNKCNEKMVKTIMIDKNGERKEILQCMSCKYWKDLPINFQE
jgi:predicted GIY-YIG superfamily endonuclease